LKWRYILCDFRVSKSKVQSIYRRLSFDRAVVPVLLYQVRQALSLGHPDQWIGRVGTKVKKNTFLKEGVTATLYGKVNLLHGFDGDDKVWVANEFVLGDFGTQLETGLGMSVEFSKNSPLYSEVA